MQPELEIVLSEHFKAWCNIEYNSNRNVVFFCYWDKRIWNGSLKIDGHFTQTELAKSFNIGVDAGSKHSRVAVCQMVPNGHTAISTPDYIYIKYAHDVALCLWIASAIAKDFEGFIQDPEAWMRGLDAPYCFDLSKFFYFDSHQGF